MKIDFLKYSVKKVIVIILLLVIHGNLFSQEIDPEVKKYADQFYVEVTGKISDIKNYYDLYNSDNSKNYIVNYRNGGYVIISSNSGENEVLGFSETNEFQIENSPLQKLLSNSYLKVELTSIINTNNKSIVKKALNTVEPYLKDVWGGVNCKDDRGNNVYPSNYYTPDHCSPGCVAISMSQVLNYYKWPKSGMGNNVYSENYNGVLKRHKAFFDDVVYDWDNMLDEYMNKSSNDMQQKAIGELIYHADVALQMNFEPSGSTSNIDKTPFVYENFFRFTSHYEDVIWSSFWDKLQQNVQAGYPVPIAVDASRTGDGHVFIANGYKEVDGKPYYYLNWGWYNDNGVNGWYNIQAWTSSSPGYNTITGAAFDILPNPQITSISKTGYGNDFIVNWEVSEYINWDEFTLEQKVDQGNWEEVASGINSKNYLISNPAREVYQFRVKSKIDGKYYENSWSEIEVFASEGDFDGYGYFGGDQYAYARQTPGNDPDFTGDYTFETWIRLKDSNVDNNVILDQQDVFTIELSDVSSSDYSVVFRSYSSNVQLSSNKGGGKLQNNQWEHIAVSHSGNVTKLFINGFLQDENTTGGFNLISSNNALNIAEKFHGSYSSKIISDLDQIRISSMARYTSNFNPVKEIQFKVDDNTIAYFNFQNVHKVRLKDQANKLSVIVKNEPDFVEWKFEKTGETLANEDFDLIKSSLTIFPNPVVNNSFRIFLSDNLDLDNIEINLFDLTGGKMRIKSISSAFNKWDLNIEEVNSGIYILQIKGKGFVSSRKIIKI